jgi:endonuclease YncB( thermonuclease family)
MQDQAPIVGRPRGNVWRVLQADGIEWEGQVYLIGDEIDLAMRLIVTRKRIAFVRGGGIALEVDRGWLNPPPTISRLGDVTLFVDAERTRNPEKLRLQFRDGRVAADQLVRQLGGGPEKTTMRSTPPVWESWSSSAYNWLDTNEPALPAATETGAYPPSTGWETYDRGLPAGPSILDSGDFPPIAESTPDIQPATSFSGSRRLDPILPDVLMDPQPDHGPADAPWMVSVDGLEIKRPGRRSIAIRLGGLVVLLAAIAFATAWRWPDLHNELPIIGDRDNQTAIEAPVDPGDANQATLPDVSPDEDDIALGVGGSNGEIEPGNTPTPTTEPESESQAATDAPATPAEVATEPPAEPTPAPTEPAETPTEAALEVAEDEPTIAPVEETPEPTAEVITPPQGPSVASGDVPDQVVIANGFRYTVESVQRAGELQGLDLPDVGGEWVVAIVRVENTSGETAVFDMGSVSLQTSGPGAQQVPLDSGTEQVAQALGLMPALGATSSALFANGEGHRMAFVFLVTPDTEGLALQLGDQRVDLAVSIQEAVDPATLGDAPEPARLFEGTVVEVLDAATITVDIEGVVYTVRINGIDVPAGDSCFASEATAATTALLAGQTVQIERQRTNTDENGHLVRDVWILQGGSAPVLASVELAAEGAATAAPEGQNTRYAGWIEESARDAESSGAGLWSACSS